MPVEHVQFDEGHLLKHPLDFRAREKMPGTVQHKPPVPIPGPVRKAHTGNGPPVKALEKAGKPLDDPPFTGRGEGYARGRHVQHIFFRGKRGVPCETERRAAVPERERGKALSREPRLKRGEAPGFKTAPFHRQFSGDGKRPLPDFRRSVNSRNTLYERHSNLP